MARSRREHLIPGAWRAMENLKYEVAAQIGLPNYYGYLGDMPARYHGAVGGNMVRRMIALAQQQLAQTTGISPSPSFSPSPTFNIPLNNNQFQSIGQPPAFVPQTPTPLVNQPTFV
ncbi:MAG TPA: alpha/beta-type small acid-soluble spore protein [Sphingobacteriaceae bacterium]|nr:alpha/beta-type small acid-soluble spore protein [Sphingobacteriaceae bacterium]